MKTLNKENRQKVTEFLRGLHTEIDPTDYINVEDLEIEDFQDDIFNTICDTIQDNNGFDQEVIYYASAIKYLAENDPSLQESLEIASDFGFDPKDLNSAVLANLLKTRNVTEEFYELRDEVNSFFSELYDELEDEE